MVNYTCNNNFLMMGCNYREIDISCYLCLILMVIVLKRLCLCGYL